MEAYHNIMRSPVRYVLSLYFYCVTVFVGRSYSSRQDMFTTAVTSGSELLWTMRTKVPNVVDRLKKAKTVLARVRIREQINERNLIVHLHIVEFNVTAFEGIHPRLSEHPN